MQYTQHANMKWILIALLYNLFKSHFLWFSVHAGEGKFCSQSHLWEVCPCLLLPAATKRLPVSDCRRTHRPFTTHTISTVEVKSKESTNSLFSEWERRVEEPTVWVGYRGGATTTADSIGVIHQWQVYTFPVAGIYLNTRVSSIRRR